MANSYTQFSTSIENLTDAEVEWWRKEIAKYDEDNENDEGDGFEQADRPCSLTIETDNGKKWLWIYAEESGDVEGVAALSQRFLKAYRPDGCFSLAWANTCDKPRLDSFGGGGVFVTAHTMRWGDSDEFIRGCREEWARNQD